jgi:photosystem II PsbY protein
MEISQVAGVDSRALVFLVILGPALAWVAFNILTPGLNQLNDMQVKNAKGKKGIPLGLGLSAAALAGMPEQADAATELMQTAGLDARIIIFGAFVPVLGWVAYNILGPGLNQLEDMQKAAAKKKGVAAGLGLSAAALLGMPEQADAATELMQTAGLDARIIIFGAFVPVLGWVAYNILGPGLNQLEDMQKAAAKKKGVAAGLGLSAAALLGMPEQADAAYRAHADCWPRRAHHHLRRFRARARLGGVQHPRPRSQPARGHAEGCREEEGCCRWPRPLGCRPPRHARAG